jgi:methyl-accepting chemotaxis protein
MAICGLNVSLDSLQGDITAKISGFISLDDALETPQLLSSYKSTLLAGMASMKANVSTMIPDIPISASGFTSLRDQLAAYVSIPSIGGLASLTSQFGGLTSLSGMANLNLADMAKSALSLSASFDPCALAGDLKIPNIVANAAGELEALADQAPDLGGTIMALKRQIPDSAVFDSLALAAKDNVHVLTSTSIADAKQLFGGMQPMLNSLKSTAATMATALPTEAQVQELMQNVQPVVEEAIQKLPSGEEVIRDLSSKMEQLVAKQPFLEDEDSTLSQAHTMLMAKAAAIDTDIIKHKMSELGKNFDIDGIFGGKKMKQIEVGDFGKQFKMWV